MAIKRYESTGPLAAYGAALTRFESVGRYEREHLAGEILERLDLAANGPRPSTTVRCGSFQPASRWKQPMAR